MSAESCYITVLIDRVFKGQHLSKIKCSLVAIELLPRREMEAL